MKLAIEILSKELRVYRLMYSAELEYYADVNQTPKIKAYLKKSRQNVLQLQKAIEVLKRRK